MTDGVLSGSLIVQSPLFELPVRNNSDAMSFQQDSLASQSPSSSGKLGIVCALSRNGGSALQRAASEFLPTSVSSSRSGSPGRSSCALAPLAQAPPSDIVSAFPSRPHDALWSVAVGHEVAMWLNVVLPSFMRVGSTLDLQDDLPPFKPTDRL